MESGLHQRKLSIRRPKVLIGIVLPFLLVGVFVVSIVSVTLFSVIQRLQEEERTANQAETFGLDPGLMLIYQEVANQAQIPWSYLAAVHQNLPQNQDQPIKIAPTKFEAEIATASQKFQVDPALIKAMIEQESAWNPKAVSPVGARGLMQLMPANCKAYKLIPETTCMDPFQNIMAGTEMIADLLKKYNGNLQLALAAYNAGQGNVEKYKGVPPFTETQNYVKKVPSLMNKYGGKGIVTDKKSVKEQISELAHTLEKNQKSEERLVSAGNLSTCMKEIDQHKPNRGALTCATYSMKPDWEFIEKVENQAQAYDKQMMWAEMGTTSSSEGTISPYFMIWPSEGTVSSRFGSRWGRKHKGIDIANKEGTPIYSVLDGKVTLIKSDPGGFGHYIVIDHGNGLTTLYGHMYPKTIVVKEGDTVKRGQKIAEIGNNGRSTGPHLHFEVKIGDISKDPLKYIGKVPES